MARGSLLLSLCLALFAGRALADVPPDVARGDAALAKGFYTAAALAYTDAAASTGDPRWHRRAAEAYALVRTPDADRAARASAEAYRDRARTPEERADAGALLASLGSAADPPPPPLAPAAAPPPPPPFVLGPPVTFGADQDSGVVGRGLVIGGATTGALFYAASIGTAIFGMTVCDDASPEESSAARPATGGWEGRSCVLSDVAPLFVPVVGPAISIGMLKRVREVDMDFIWIAPMATQALGQAVGLVLIAAGAGTWADGTVRVTPHAGSSGAGVTIDW
jgi:hypothetical protein